MYFQICPDKNNVRNVSYLYFFLKMYLTKCLTCLRSYASAYLVRSIGYYQISFWISFWMNVEERLFLGTFLLWGIRFHDLTINWTRRPPGPTLHYQQSWLGFEPMTLRSSSHCRGCYHSTHPMVLKGFEPTIDPNSTHNCLYSQKIGMDSNLWTYLSVSDLLPQYPYSGSSRDPLKGGPGFEPTSFWQC